MLIRYKSAKELELMRAAGLACVRLLDSLCEAAQPGVTTWELDEMARGLIRDAGLKSAFLGYYGYPAVICTSVNEVVVHGIPRRDEVLADGDILSIDFGAYLEGFCGDVARTLIIGEARDPSHVSLVKLTLAALNAGLDTCRVGSKLGDIGSQVQTLVESEGCSVVRQFTGHGIGRKMHEDPLVKNYGRPSTGRKLKQGLVIAVEPMVNAGTHQVEILEDDWTAVTCDGSLAAHFEDTVAITEAGPWVLTRPDASPGNLGSVPLRV